MYTIEKGRKIDSGTYGVIEITHTGSAQDTSNMQKGKTFYVYNTGNASMTFGPSSAGCLMPIAAGGKDGPFVTTDGHFYTKGTAGQKAVIMFVEDLG